MPEFSERTQMVMKLALLFGVTGLIALSMYFLFFRAKPDITPPVVDNGSPTTDIGGLPSSGTGGSTGGGVTPPTGGTGNGQLPSSPVANGGRTDIITLTTSAVTEPTLMGNGAIAYYDEADGKFYSINKNGGVVLLADTKFPEAENITFSSTATEALVEFPDGSNVIYDFSQGEQVTLPPHWEDFSFSENGDEVASKSITTDPSARALVVTSADGSTTKVVAPLGANDDQVSVNWSPDGSILGFSRTGSNGSAFGQNEIFLIGADGEAAGILLVNGTNFNAIWSPNSSNLLYSVADAGADYKATLWYADKDGDRKTAARKSIPLQTLAEKCTFASDSVAYCAVPTVMPTGGGTSPSLITANDNIYRVDLPTGRVSLLAIPSVNTKMFNLEVSAAGDLLYFTDKSGRLNYLRLK